MKKKEIVFASSYYFLKFSSSQSEVDEVSFSLTSITAISVSFVKCVSTVTSSSF